MTSDSLGGSSCFYCVKIRVISLGDVTLSLVLTELTWRYKDELVVLTLPTPTLPKARYVNLGSPFNHQSKVKRVRLVFFMMVTSCCYCPSKANAWLMSSHKDRGKQNLTWLVYFVSWVGDKEQNDAWGAGGVNVLPYLRTTAYVWREGLTQSVTGAKTALQPRPCPDTERPSPSVYVSTRQRWRHLNTTAP